MSNKNAELLQKYLSNRKSIPQPERIKVELKKQIDELVNIEKRVNNVRVNTPAN